MVVWIRMILNKDETSFGLPCTENLILDFFSSVGCLINQFSGFNDDYVKPCSNFHFFCISDGGNNCQHIHTKGKSLSFFISPFLIKARLCKVRQFPHELMKPLYPKLIGFFGFCPPSTVFSQPLHLVVNDQRDFYTSNLRRVEGTPTGATPPHLN